MKLVGLTIAAAVLLVGCPLAPVCEQLQTQCAGSSVQVCAPDGQWREIMDCAELYGDGEWVCMEHITAGHACLPEGE